ncbi:S-layer homology domain-containing protein [Paenibacillus sp. FJAT-27812]|uniref:S-layer homology domain-containing protein n=1 Tax=Paenibacillus sp. FJAT-27812 TaxID=1684143 RepID=UPI0006A792D5|nr:S-layer homology domain-containing protein [Paenibacillus sp. FJAT-27812]
MGKGKRSGIFILALLLFIASNYAGVEAVAAAVNSSSTTVLQNEFIKITVDNSTGRFGIRTVEGQPIRKKDQNVDMLFRGDDPETSFTTFKIDGTDYIFGNPYKFSTQFFSETSKPRIIQNTNGTKQIETIWKIKGVEIKQILMLYTDSADKLNAGNVNIRYEVVNKSGAQVEVGSRILLDTMVAGNDGPEFQIGTTYKSPLTVERKLVHDPERLGIPAVDQPVYKLPAYWVMRDKLDLDNPQATNVIAYGFNNFAEGNINIVDEMTVGHWNSLANTKWDYTPNPNLDFTRDTNDYGTADSAVAFYWNPKKLAKQATKTFETVYGLGEIIAPDKVFSIRYIDPVQQLATLEDNSAYVNEGIFDINVEIENLAMFDMEHSKITVDMALQNGLSFVRVDNAGHIVRDKDNKPVLETFRTQSLERKKTATPEETANNIEPMYKPGETVTATFKVQATGRPWPVTRQYMVTAKSPETQKKMEGMKDEGIKAQFESSKTNFILLPAVGEAVPTYVYGMSPPELYSSDVKYISLNLSNIEAYNTGNDTTAPNFDLYLQEKVTGKRYKADVKNAVILQPGADGFAGDMRITYRGGDLVDAAGTVVTPNLGPELPLGEYVVEIDYKGTAGGDKEIEAMYDITTSQSFFVTDNEESRIREANILAIYKQTVDLSFVTPNVSGKLLEEINDAFPGTPFKNGTDLYSAVTRYKEAKTIVGMASKATDPEFDLAEYLDAESLKEVAAYQYQLFESEEELEEFFEEEDGPEQLVVIRGMIKQVGTGDEQQLVVDTKTEPAIINESVAYSGKDIVLVPGKLDLGLFTKQPNKGALNDIPFFDTLIVKGDGILSVSSSGFVFHQGEWTLDFYNGFNKSLGEGYIVNDEELPDSEGNEEDDSLNGSLDWAAGGLGDALHPLRKLMIETIYFNKHSLFAAPSFSIDGFGLTFNDFILREGGVSFGGSISLKILEAEMRNVIFNDKGFVGIDAGLKFDLGQDLGLFGAEKSKDGGDEEGSGGTASGKINIVHFAQKVEGVNNQYGLQFKADLKDMVKVQIELSLKQVDDGRILPDVIAFGTSLPDPGVLITGATYLTDIRGAVRELADTIAGGTKKDPFPLIVEAGVSLKFGVAPAYFFGDIDLTVKRTGLKVEGKMDYSSNPEPEDDDLVPMLTKAMIEAQWVTPWFVRLEAEVDVGGWDVIIGKAGIFVGQNLEKNRIDFEGYIGARVQIPSSVPVVGGMPLSSVFLGINNDKLWGSVGILFISLGITYYWGGGVEFGTSGEQLPEGFIHMVIEDPEKGPRLMVIGQGVETLATSWLDTEKESQEITYRKVSEGVSVLDTGSMGLGMGGIVVKNSGRVHEIPLNGVSGNAMIEMDYDATELPSFTLKDSSGKLYPVIFDNTNTNPQANAFTQHISADQSADGVDSRKAYIIIPQDRAAAGGTWTLTSVKKVESRLLNIPTAPELTDVKLNQSGTDANAFTAEWKVNNAQAGDTINLYLTEDALADASTAKAGGQEVLEPGEPGLLIAKDLPVDSNGSKSGRITSGSKTIDASNVSLLGDTEDIRGLLQQGHYYLRAELKSEGAFGTKTSKERFEIIDPLAPSEVSDVLIQPAGNGLFALSFKPSAKKAGHAGFEHSYALDAFKERGGVLETYEPFGQLLFTETELAPYWNAAKGIYEGILIGGWAATSTSNAIDQKGLVPLKNANIDVKYTGLEIDKDYIIGVSAVTKPTKAADKNENYHFAGSVKSAMKHLPYPNKPVLNASSTDGRLELDSSKKFIKLLTNKTEQTIGLIASHKDVEVEAFYADQSIGKTSLKNEGPNSRGELTFDRFKTDGPYAIELVSTNKATHDVSVTMLYITVDTLAPVLYIDEPVTGARTTTGTIQVAGMTSNDARLWVNGHEVPVADDGKFKSLVSIEGKEATAPLHFVSEDLAGNENTATVIVSDSSFEAPAALVLKPLEKIKPGDSVKVKAVLKFADGKSADGKPKFKEKEIAAADLKRLHFSIGMGDAVHLTDAGEIIGLDVGASLIEAEYKLTDDVSLKAMAAVTVDWPEQTTLRRITAFLSPISGVTNKTMATIGEAGDMTGQQLAYKVYPQNGADAQLPTFGQDLSEWANFPRNGQMDAAAGDTIIIAARASLTKKATATSAKLAASLWTAGGGGGGGIILPPVMPEGPVEVVINNKPVQAEREQGGVSIQITTEMLQAAGSDDVVIAGADEAVAGYSFRMDASAVKQAVDSGKSISISLPMAQITLTPKMLEGAAGGLSFKVGVNDEAGINASKNLAKSLSSSLLGDGQGVTITSNLPEASWNGYVSLHAAVPKTVQAREIKAVILQSADGTWTTLPWKLGGTAEKPYVDVKLTGEGKLIFLTTSQAFGDVRVGYWGEKSIGEAASKLFLLGKGKGRFEPDSPITRAEYPTILLRVAGLMNKTADEGFTDVKANAWYKQSVSIAAKLGIVNGLADGSFAPAATLNRMEAMAMVGRLLKSLELGGDLDAAEAAQILSSFEDKDSIPEWAVIPVALTIKHGIILGDKGKVNPGDALTRAQAAAIAARLDPFITNH